LNVTIGSKTSKGKLIMQVASSIFKAYDIRGIVPTTVTEETAEGIGDISKRRA
jgi:phosphomannomutase